MIRDQANSSNYHSHHSKCGDANLKNLVAFEGHAKVLASRLPPKKTDELQKGMTALCSHEKEKKVADKGD